MFIIERNPTGTRRWLYVAEVETFEDALRFVAHDGRGGEWRILAPNGEVTKIWLPERVKP